MRRSSIAACLSLLLPAVALASPSVTATFTIAGGDPTVGVLPSYNDTYANWKNAGLLALGGIPNRTTVCATVSPTGVIPPASNDDAATINAAIASCPAGDVLMLAAGAFQIAQSEYIWLNKGITLRGTGTGNNSASPYWSTVLNVYNGAIADWTISGATSGANCGVTSASVSACSAATGVILMSPSGNYNWGWAGCNLGTTPTGCGTTLAADVAQGVTTVQVASTANFSVGMYALIDENPQVVSTANPLGNGQANVMASSDFLSTSGSPATLRLEGGDEPTSYSFNPNRLNAEIHKVTAIGAGPCPGTNCTLTFDDPVTLAFRQSGSHDARVYWPTVQGPTANPFLQQAGVENLTITKAANGGVQFTFCADCWMKGVEVGTWIAGAANVNYSIRTQIDSGYFHDCADCENNGAEYPVGINQASTETYVVNNIIVRGGKGMVGRGANTAVIAYNYTDDTMYMTSVIGDYWRDQVLNGSHYAGTHHFLFEGNLAASCDDDETHGNAIYHTFFRNDCTGFRSTFTDPSRAYLGLASTVNDEAGIAYYENQTTVTAPGPLRAVGQMAFSYWMAFVGNVIGTSGQTTTANGWSYQCSSVFNETPGNKCEWLLGWTASEWNYAPDPNLNGTNNPQFIFRHGDYDYLNGSSVDWTTGYSHTLPNSFYLSAKPTFFGADTWPWVNPTGPTLLYTNPAQARYVAGTPFATPP
jgi:hypothetical protein